MWCVAIGEEEVLQSGMDGEIGVAGLHCGLEGLNKPFGEAIGGGVVWCRAKMQDAVALEEVRELVARELRTVVADELLGNSMVCEERAQMLDGFLGGG